MPETFDDHGGETPPAPRCSFDTETYGTDFRDRMFAFSIGYGKRVDYVDIRETPEEEWLPHLKALFGDPDRKRKHTVTEVRAVCLGIE